jgi:hypothetical protein
MDVTKSADWKATMDAVAQKFGKCDILVNNAGWSYTNKPTLTVTEEEFEKVFDVNVKGVFLGCNAWVQQAIERKEGGVVINIASVGATRPRPGLVYYNASKAAVWNVCNPSSSPLLFHLTLVSVDGLTSRSGYQGVGRRIRTSSDSCCFHLPVGDGYRAVFCFHGHGGYARKQDQVHG